ncbi:MAG: RHS repeat-associated core domain-containing protein [Bacteroidales bacterium]|nr:RHS repeat-associated core domain-containing protein [Bacteroidales bacterium]
MVNEGNTYEYQYFIKDHLGNTRVNFTENGNIIQEDAYYPFGMQMNGLCYETGTDFLNKNLYNGKELQDDFGLGWYDYGARFYDAQIGKWHSVDPFAEGYYSLSPYNYTMNNPILFIDPNGMFVDNYEIYSDGNIVKYETDDNTNNYIYIDGDGKRHEIGTYAKNDKGLIQLTDVDYKSGETEVDITAKPGNDSELHISGNAIASLIGASADSGEEIYVTRVSNSDGSSPKTSTSHKDGNVLDTRYAQNNGSRAILDYNGDLTAFNKIDQTASSSMNAGLSKFGWSNIRSSTLTITNTATVNGKEVTTSTNYNVSGTVHLKDHYNHQHVQGYNPSILTRILTPAALTPRKARVQ